MKLQKRFHQQAQKRPSDLQKMRIYQQFLDKSHRSISYHKVTYYTKVAIFSLGLFFLGGTIYYSGRPLGIAPYQIAEEGNGYIALQEMPGQFVQAETIGKIIHANGRISITHKDTEIETDQLSSNDRVLLAVGAEMQFRIDDHIHAKITGPAEFFLEDAGNQEGVKKYIINLISGDYLEIVTLPTRELLHTETIDISTQKNIAPQVTVKAADFTIEQVDTRGSLDLVISTTKDGKKHVANKGTEIVMKKIVAEKQTYVAIQQDETVAVNGHIAFVAGEEIPIEEVLAKVEEAKFAVRYEIEEAGRASYGTAITIGDVLLDSTTLQKQVIPQEVAEFVEHSLSVSGLQRYVGQMHDFYTEEDMDAFMIAYTNLMNKIARGYELVGAPYILKELDPGTLTITAEDTRILVNILEQRWYTEPGFLQGLRNLSVSLDMLVLDISQQREDQKEQEEPEENPNSNNNSNKKEKEEGINIHKETALETAPKEDISSNTEEEENTRTEDTLEDTLQGVIDPTIPIQ